MALDGPNIMSLKELKGGGGDRDYLKDQIFCLLVELVIL